MAVEVVILMPILFMFVLFIVAFGRYVGVKGDIESTARDAARAASMEATRAGADATAYRVVNATLESTTTCAAPTVGGTWAPGGELYVELNCEVSYDQLGLLGVPGSVPVSATSYVPLDPYRTY